MDVILDNIGFSLQKMGGLSMVWKALVESVKESGLTYKCIEYPGAHSNEVRRVMSDYIVEERHPLSMFLERYRNTNIQEDTPFVYHSSIYRTSKGTNAINVITVHDFVYERYYSGLQRKVHCWQKYNAIRNADVVVSISENTKKDILHYLPDVDEDKIRVIYNGVSEDYKPVSHSRFAEMGNYIVFVGSRQPYKNFNFVVESIKDTNYSLAIVGGGLTQNETKYLESNLGYQRYKYMGYLSNQDLNELYNACYCLAYPSGYEGFGIPILEAQKSCCPVIAFNYSSIPEVMGNSPLLMGELRTDEFKEKLRMLKMDSLRNTVIEQGLDNSTRFSWKKMGQDYVQLYKDLLNK